MIKATLPRLVAAGIAGLLIACSGNGKQSAENGEEVKVLRFSAIPDEDTTAQKERFQPVADYLSKALGIDVEFVPSINYGASVEKFENNDVQLAWFGGVTGVQAMNRVEGARALVAGQKDLAFKSYFIANASTGLEASEDFPAAIADLKFTYGSSSSTSGCIMPSHFIIENTGKTPGEFFKEKPGFSGAHDKTAMLVQDGSFQAGALSFGTYEKLVAAGKLDPEKCVKIWETPTYADYNMTAHPDLENTFGEGFLDKLQQALVDCQDEAALKALGREKLVKVNNETFSGIAAVMEKVKFD